MRTRRQSAKKSASTEVICEWASNGIDPFSTFLLMECVTIDIPYTRVAFKLILYDCKFLSEFPGGIAFFDRVRYSKFVGANSVKVQFDRLLKPWSHVTFSKLRLS